MARKFVHLHIPVEPRDKRDWDREKKQRDMSGRQLVRMFLDWAAKERARRG